MPTTDELHTFLQTRRSIRRFQPDPVPQAVIENILHTATFAPSAHNRQPWRFAVVTEPALKTRLGEAVTAQMQEDMQAEGADPTEIKKRTSISLRRINEAPLIITLCRDKTDVRTNTPEETIMGIQSTALAGLQLLLAAHAEGLGGNWVCWALYAQQAIRTVLNLPQTWEPQAFYFLGYPAEIPPQKDRKTIKDITAFCVNAENKP